MAATVTANTAAGRARKIEAYDLSNWAAAADTATITHTLGAIPAYVFVQAGVTGMSNADAEAASIAVWIVQTVSATQIVLRKANVAGSNVAGTGARVFVCEQLPAQLLEAAALGASLAGRIPPQLAAVAAIL